MRTVTLTVVSLVIATIVAVTASAASVDKLVLTCLDQQEISNDNIYISFQVDGKVVNFGMSDQRGTSRERPMKMGDGGELVLDESTRKQLTFGSKLRIVIREKDGGPNPDETFFEQTIGTNEQEDKVFDGGLGARKWRYKLSWKTLP